MLPQIGQLTELADVSYVFGLESRQHVAFIKSKKESTIEALAVEVCKDAVQDAGRLSGSDLALMIAGDGIAAGLAIGDYIGRMEVTSPHPN